MVGADTRWHRYGSFPTDFTLPDPTYPTTHHRDDKNRYDERSKDHG
jgi:hypothetical protein